MKGDYQSFDERERVTVPVPSKRNRIGLNLLYVSRRTRASQSRRNLVLFPVRAITASVLCGQSGYKSSTTMTVHVHVHGLLRMRGHGDASGRGPRRPSMIFSC